MRMVSYEWDNKKNSFDVELTDEIIIFRFKNCSFSHVENKDNDVLEIKYDCEISCPSSGELFESEEEDLEKLARDMLLEFVFEFFEEDAE